MLRLIIGALVGGAVGFTMGYFGRCSTGTCPLTGNPYISTIVGIIFGILVSKNIGK